MFLWLGYQGKSSFQNGFQSAELVATVIDRNKLETIINIITIIIIIIIIAIRNIIIIIITIILTVIVTITETASQRRNSTIQA